MISSQVFVAALAIFLGTPFPNVRPDETVVFFPTESWQVEGGRAWMVHIHGWIFETEWRRNLLGPLYDALEDDDIVDVEGGADPPDDDEITRGRDTFIQRAAPFLVDNQRGKKIKIKLGERVFTLPPSAPDGHFEETLRFEASELEALRKAGTVRGDWLSYMAVLPEGDERLFEGRVRLIGPTGLSVVSDIDDTVKVTRIRTREEMLRHTFVLPFEAIPGMPEVFTQWSNRPDVVFHYVSSSPWQLHEPLAQLLCPPAFPACTLHLRRVRLGGGNIFTAFQGGEGHKRAALTALLERYPGRRFVLIGDESELDPEIFSALAREYPRQVVRIFIRDPDLDGSASRYRKLFDGLPPQTAVVFREPRQLRDLLPPPMATSQPAGPDSTTSRPVVTTR